MLEVLNLTRRFGDLVAVDDVSFEVHDGLLTGFVGGNGAGKTTTMRMIMGLLGIDSGRVRWRGREITRSDRRRFGYMPEERGLYPKQKVAEQLEYLGMLSGMSRADARASVHTQLERFGLGDRTDERVERLSLGNQQRVQIVAALMAHPQALILDEPFSGLDPGAVDAMVDLLTEHTAEGVPILFSSHQLDLVERICDRLVILSRGRVVAQGTVEELRTSGPVRHRIELDHDAGWVRDVPGLTDVRVDGAGATFTLGDGADSRALLERALTHGEVRSFERVVPTVSEIYREVST